MIFGRSSAETVQRFASQLGLPLRPGRDGSVGFAFASSGTLTLTPVRDGSRILVSLTRKQARVDGDRLAAVLEKSGFQRTTNRIVRAGLTRTDDLLLTLCLNESEFDLPTIEACFRDLAALHDQLG